ncbi:hypothetical protein [Carboxylicivirga sp. RSCT41]|uniref:hypothetical protein n=1 Tax=Carboxylicivirga agarovorans TaxID=3417570 RepID=UPI003D348137
MRTHNQIDKILKTKRLVLSPSQAFQHYFIVLIPLFPMGLMIYNEPESIYGFGIWIFGIVSIIAYLIQRKRLRFKEFKANCNIEHLKNSLFRTTNELEWKIEKTNEKYLQAYSGDPFNYYGGNLITIIPIEKGFLINSVSDPRKRSVPFISTWDKDNIQTFVKHLKDVLNNKEENKDYLIPQKEWTTQKTIKRLLIYPFLLFIVLISLKSISEPASAKGVSAGIAGLIFGIGYFFIDIKLILKRKKYKRTTRRT